MKRAVRTIRRLLDLALVLLVGSVLAIVLLSTFGPSFGHQLLVVRGGSMSPAIPLGTLVDVASTPPDQIQPGDVITIKADNGVLTTHRVVRVAQLPDGIYFATKGDANETADPVLEPASRLQGRIDLSLPFLGYLMYLLTTPSGVISIFGLAMTLLFAIWLLQEFEEDEDEEEKPSAYEMPGLAALLPPANDAAPRTSEWIG